MGHILKALTLYSGGLDSILAIKLVMEQDCQVYAISFKTPFFSPKNFNLSTILRGYPEVKIYTMDITSPFLKMLICPKHGYGKNLNPCIDCKVLMLSCAKSYMEKLGCDFIFTGEVLGQRPMSQRRDTLRIIEKESGLEGILLRPLSAKLLPPTSMEMEGLIKRERLLDISGRSRKRQIEMLRGLNQVDYPTPAGGCLLTDSSYTRRLRSLLKMNKGILDTKIIKWLRIGRHFDLPEGVRVIVGRNQKENEKILHLAAQEVVLKTVAVPGPIAVILGESCKDTIRFAASLMASYSDTQPGCDTEVIFGLKGNLHEGIMVTPISRKLIEAYRV